MSKNKPRMKSVALILSELETAKVRVTYTWPLPWIWLFENENKRWGTNKNLNSWRRRGRTSSAKWKKWLLFSTVLFWSLHPTKHWKSITNVTELTLMDSSCHVKGCICYQHHINCGKRWNNEEFGRNRNFAASDNWKCRKIPVT